MILASRILCVFGIVFIFMACTGTKTKSSWKSSDYKDKVQNIYIIGIAKSEYNRVFFENAFYGELAKRGVKSIPSSVDLPQNEETNRERIINFMKINKCDSVLLTRVVEQETKASFQSGKETYRFMPGPYYGGSRLYSRPSHYTSWGTYYRIGYRATSQTPTTSSITVITVESVLYDLKTEELIWSARLETYKQAKIEDMIKSFVVEAIKDLKDNGLI